MLEKPQEPRQEAHPQARSPIPWPCLCPALPWAPQEDAKECIEAVTVFKSRGWGRHGCWGSRSPGRGSGGFCVVLTWGQSQGTNLWTVGGS